VTVAETLLVFVGAPLAVIVGLALLIYVPGGRNKRPRYKPGQSWDYAPVWYEPHPEHASADSHGETMAIGSSMYGERHGEAAAATAADTRTGTMHADTSHGAPAHGATAQRPVSAGPLGGARGTW